MGEIDIADRLRRYWAAYAVIGCNNPRIFIIKRKEEEVEQYDAAGGWYHSLLIFYEQVGIGILCLL